MKTKTPYPPLGGMESGAQAPSLQVKSEERKLQTVNGKQ